MNEGAAESLIQLIVAWLPLVVIVAVFAFMIRKSNSYYRKYDDNVSLFMKSNEELVAVNREMAHTLTDIRTLLEGRKS